MKILLFGGTGQLGQEITPRARDLSLELVTPVTSEVDISDEQGVRAFINRVHPELIINSAAYTNVDGAEMDRERAFKVNHLGARYVRQGAESIGARLIHISTDYVFPGTATTPISESAVTAPPNVYGESKLRGEEEVLQLGESALVLRTSSLYGARGKNFVATMLNLFQSKEEISVVADQVMSPTWAGWLAEAVLDMARIKANGIYHATCRGAVSWFDFTAYILGQVQVEVPEAKRVKLVPTTAEAFGRPAKRPSYSVLDCSKLEGILGRPTMKWEDGLKAYLRDIGLSA